MRFIFITLALLFFGLCGTEAQVLLDDFEISDQWTCIASDGVNIKSEIVPGRTGNALKIDFDFTTGAGYCGIQRRISKTLPENYRFSFHLRGEAPRNNLEFKLVDESGLNVWWNIQRNFEFPDQWSRVTYKKRHISFAWGPTSDRDLKAFDKIEFMISSSTGGRGSIYLDDLTFQELEPASQALPIPSVLASSQLNDSSQTENLVDRDSTTSWRSATTPEHQTIILDLGRNYEYGGLVISWDGQEYAKQYQIAVSVDGAEWEHAYQVTRGKRGKSYIFLKDYESRFIKLDLQRSASQKGYAIKEIWIKDVEFSETMESFYSHLSADYRRGAFPRYLQREQSFWTVVGVSGDTHEALINEDGMVEVDKNQFSIEPSVFYRGRWHTWSDVSATQTLEKGYLPIPQVTWQNREATLNIRAFASGEPGKSILYLCYDVCNNTATELEGNLYLAIRPFQVNPPWQFLNWPGGTAKIRQIRRDAHRVLVNETKSIYFLPASAQLGAVEFDEGDLCEFLKNDQLPDRTDVTDHFGYASGALQFPFRLKPGRSAKVYLAIPFHETTMTPADLTEKAIQKELKHTIDDWDKKVSRVAFSVPEEAEKLVQIIKSNLAYILINRDKAGIQPGSRSYERSWIRDGSLTSSALLRFGLVEEVRQFLEWYAQHLFPNGKVPCVVDHRGPDPVSENDSNGQFIFGFLQYYLFTQDRAFLERHWDQIRQAVTFMNELIAQRSTDYYRDGNDSLRAFYGLLPESISHEGYSAQPMHSYWDNFFALLGYKDAVTIAQILEKTEDEQAFRQARDRFRENLYRSLELAMRNKKIDFIPGCVELGDFDATSTAIALYPCNEGAYLPQPAAKNTFDRYFDYFTKRFDASFFWRDFTPYEVRLIGAFIRMGEIERARQLITFFLAQQHPPGWNHWAEIVYRDPRTPSFIGDMPHTWVGSDFINSVRMMFAYEDEVEDALIIGAGLHPHWLESRSGISVARFPTYYGSLSFQIKSRRNQIQVKLTGAVQMPTGQIRIKNVRKERPQSVRINDVESHNFDTDEIRVQEFPANVIIEYP